MTPSLIAPTSLGIRQVDSYGGGWFGASRRAPTAGVEAAGERYRHKGTDFICAPGEPVLSPAGVRLMLCNLAYEDDARFHSLHLEVVGDAAWKMKLLYASPTIKLLEEVEAGQPFAVAEDIRSRYPEITPHVHLEVRHFGILVNPESLLAASA